MTIQIEIEEAKQHHEGSPKVFVYQGKRACARACATVKIMHRSCIVIFQPSKMTIQTGAAQ